jgi:GNAT superfamily N-acetyltransferase
VAESDGRIIGVICIGPDEDGAMVIHALGVVHDRRREGIGTHLKKVALVDAAADGHGLVVSFVHRRNTPMLKLNEKLGVVAQPDADDPEYMFSVVAAEVYDEGAGAEGP